MSQFYFTGKPCIRGHVSPRYADNSDCVECRKERSKEFSEKNPERRKAISRKSANKIRNADPESARERSRTLYAANIEHYREYTKRQQKKRREEKPDVVRAYDRERDKSMHQQHPEKVRAKSKIRLSNWRRNNPEKNRIKNAKDLHTRRARKLSSEGTFNAADIISLFEKQDGTCVYCEAPLPAGYHIDHKTPLSRGGSNWPVNLQLLCPTCNMSKNAKTHEEYLGILCHA